MKSKYDRLKETALEANLELPKRQLVVSTFGNVSVIDREQGVFAIKPSGVPYEELSPDKMVVVDFECRVVDGSLRPSSDTRTHAVLYSEWRDLGAIVHTHSTYATAWAQARRSIPVYGTTHADVSAIDIPCAPPLDDKLIEGNYEYATGRQIIDFFASSNLDHRLTGMVLLASHAPFTWGADVYRAVHNSVLLETIARLAYLTEQIGINPPRMKDALIRKHFERKHGSQAYYGQQ